MALRPTSTLLPRMLARDPHEHPRAATPLELLFDLCFVVAIAQLATSLHHGIAHGHAIDGVGPYIQVFLAVWWAWMGFTWFASSFDTDDPLYRVKVLVQMIGVLVLAAGVPRAFETGDFTFLTYGYVILRIGLVALWLRAARANPNQRVTALRYAGGIFVLQLGWIGLLSVPAAHWFAGWAVLMALELLLPMWAESASERGWHSHHIAERYGLMTIIVVGESVLAATLAIQSALDLGTPPGSLVRLIVAAPIILFSMWWLYFSQPGHRIVESTVRAFLWGYGHFFVFASAAAVGAAIAVGVDQAAGKAHLGELELALVLAVPVAVFLVSVWLVQVRLQPQRACAGWVFPTAALLVLTAAWTPVPALSIATILAAATATVTLSDPETAG